MKQSMQQQREPTLQFDIYIDGTPVAVKAKPYTANTQRRFRVSYNGSPIHIFGWDQQKNQLTAIERSPSDNIPEKVEHAISRHLQQYAA